MLKNRKSSAAPSAAVTSVGATRLLSPYRNTRSSNSMYSKLIATYVIALHALSTLTPVAVAHAEDLACSSPIAREASLAEIQAFVRDRGRSVVSFVGYSEAGYEDTRAMLDHAARALDRFDPRKAIINIGGTESGVGAIYELAKARGFITIGIVSALAQKQQVTLARCVDFVFYVADDSWGGVTPGTRELAATSAAIVAVSDEMVGIGGGEIARDELLAMRAAGKHADFIPADMNHTVARERAHRRLQPEPVDFRGSAHRELMP